MALSQKQVRMICMSNYTGLICKYLDGRYDKTNGNVSVCTKLTPKAFADLESRRKQQGYYGKPPTGDNCSGYPLLIITKQGYDVGVKT